MANLDLPTVSGFGQEWKFFDQNTADRSEIQTLFQQYFGIFPWKDLPPDAVGADLGCGSGRWAKLVAPRVGHLHLVDASEEALSVARKNLQGLGNLSFHRGSIEEIGISENSLDFAFSLGVLHHLPDTRQALKDIARRLKPGSPFLVYLYYAFDHRPAWYRLLWKMTDMVRVAISKLSFPVKLVVTQALAVLIYWPIARTARILEKVGLLPSSWPLAYYRDRSLYVMRTDALDRFGTRLEKRYTQREISEMLTYAGFERTIFSVTAPFWCAVSYKGHSNVS